MSDGGDAAAVEPLRRNRDFLLLQAGQLVSTAGSQVSAIATPLLVLALTGSATRAGLVAFLRTAAMFVLSLPAGVACDHFNRKAMLVVSDVISLLATGAIGVALVTGHATYPLVLAASTIDGGASALFMAAWSGALRSVVPPQQISAAVNVTTARMAVVRLGGPTLGGALFAVSRAIPFLADAASYVASTVSLLVMRAPFRHERDPDPGPLRARLGAGFGFVWHQPFLRTCLALFGVANMLFPGLTLALVVISTREGHSTTQTGALIAVVGTGLLLGSLVSGPVRRLLPGRFVLVLESWCWCVCSLFLVWPTAYGLALGMLPAAIAIPSTDATVHGYRYAVTPDRLLGRVEASWATLSLAITPLGPLLAGELLGHSTQRVAIGAFAGLALGLALWNSLAPSMRLPSGSLEVTAYR